MAQHPITGVEIAGYGAALPDNLVTNRELGDEALAEWASKKIGIDERHLSDPDNKWPNSTLSARAGEAALRMAGLEAPYRLSTVRAGTWSPDRQTPGTAGDVHFALNMEGGGILDQNSACASFVYALLDAYREFPSDDGVNDVLVIGSDIVSRSVDFTDDSETGMKNKMLFGDGAGAVLLKRNPERPESGLLAWHTDTHSEYRDALYVYRGEPIHMDGRMVFDGAVELGTLVCRELFDKAYQNAGIEADEVASLVLHQANMRIIKSIARNLGLPSERIATSIRRHANTSAASIPMALAEQAHEGKIKPGDVVAMVGFGAGLTFAGAVLRW